MSLGSSLMMRWVLIAADGLIAHTNPGHADTVARRKGQAYQLLKHSLSQNQGKITDDVLSGIIMAAVTEARLSDPMACNAHLKGYEAAIEARGGIKRSLMDCEIPALGMAHLMPYFVCEPLPAAEGSVEEEQVQRFIEFLISRMNDATGSDGVSPRAGLDQLKRMVVRLGLLRSGLRFYLQPDEREVVSRFPDEAALFLALFLVMRTLWIHRESAEDCQLFISRLDAFFEASTGFDPHTGRPSLTGQGLACVVIKVIQNLPGTPHSYGGVSTLIHSVDAVRAYRTMTLRSARERARAILCRILSGYDF
ncbi:hypothetical protein ASPSYDRAFT_492133 [Aspergillus sydowii CBS 593.65]|uniref:Uncharacterized protein n=1 Tax=Aspergillus sydowii CBS 593.65 TaxID=1036612 RepID=A0A1L9T4F3_9EURO|nr:uncharacterized protein ASPSYDRAFT_492133 [Aspergillus sydowii CBS 593.65]OJJ54173.1 hypothetical protein ASPSYDRAFT_492133 [Aspergillus sydowii CBS 593.65]